MWPPWLKFLTSIKVERVTTTPAENLKIEVEDSMIVRTLNITFAKFLLVAKTKLRSIVDLSANCTVVIQLVFATKTESGSIGTGSPSQLNTSFELGVHFLEQSSSKLLSIITINNK